MSQFPTPTQDDIQRVVDLVVQEVRPLRVVLFGSAARGDLRPGSDLDLLVVVHDDADRDQTERALYAMPRPGLRVAVDFIVTTPLEFERLRHRTTLVYRRIWREGREVYAA